MVPPLHGSDEVRLNQLYHDHGVAQINARHADSAELRSEHAAQALFLGELIRVRRADQTGPIVGPARAPLQDGRCTTIHIYGVPESATVRKARKWLDDNGLVHTFHDFEKEGATQGLVRGWVVAVGWERALNRQCMTFRELETSQKEHLDAEKAIRLMIARPSCIRSPVTRHPGGVLVGFHPAEWEAMLA